MSLVLLFSNFEVDTAGRWRENTMGWNSSTKKCDQAIQESSQVQIVIS